MLKVAFFLIILGTSNVLALEFNAVPEKFEASNIKILFGTALVTEGAVGINISFTVNNDILPARIIEYYKEYYNAEWDLCINHMDTDSVDMEGNQHKFIETNFWFNEKRLLGAMLRVGKNIKTEKTQIFIDQYYYRNKEQYDRESNVLCK